MLEITIGVEAHKEVITELKLSVEEEEEIKSREKNGNKMNVISGSPADLKGISRCEGQESGVSPPMGERRLIPMCGVYAAPRRSKMQHLDRSSLPLSAMLQQCVAHQAV